MIGMALFALVNLWPAFHYWRVGRHIGRAGVAAKP